MQNRGGCLLQIEVCFCSLPANNCLRQRALENAITIKTGEDECARLYTLMLKISLTPRVAVLTIAQIAERIITLLDPRDCCESPDVSPHDHTAPTESRPHVVICWDESHSLIDPVAGEAWTIFSELRRALRTIKESSIISVFLSTAGKFHSFSPSPEYDPSMRLMTRKLKMLPPITEVSFDLFAEKVDCIKEEWTLQRIASTHQIVHLELCESPVAIICVTNQSNRRLRFPTRFDSGDLAIKRSIVAFAADKLLCRPSEDEEDKPKFKLKSEESLACLAVRLGLDFRATSWSERAAERTQVERHMRICLAATAGFRSMITISPSEPLLAEASWTVMKKCLGPKEVPRALLDHINDSYLNPGDRGEVVAALLLLLARDRAIQDGEASKCGSDAFRSGFKRDGGSRVVTVLEFLDALVPSASRTFVRGRKPSRCSEGHSPLTNLENAFGKSNIYFNHFIKVHDFKIINRRYLCHLICRGAAVICAYNQKGIDILVPTLMGTILQPQFVSAILIQVKNDPRFTNKVVPSSASLFMMMEPFKVGLFSTRDANAPLPPVLRIVLALASKKPGVTGPNLPTRQSPCPNNLDKFTVYDLWIAGVSAQSFGVIPDETHGQYRDLLARTRNVFNGYGALTKDGGGLEEGERCRINLRRMMHAAAASKDQHFQNYIADPSPAPITRKYDVEVYVTTLRSTDVNETNPVHSDEDFSTTSDEDVGAPSEPDEMAVD